eukprot:m.307451 g.307451  ORF g.307451 m.307451 type:complete len:386 (+) comp55315_c0_seq3:832-1989(+)
MVQACVPPKLMPERTGARNKHSNESWFVGEQGGSHPFLELLGERPDGLRPSCGDELEDVWDQNVDQVVVVDLVLPVDCLAQTWQQQLLLEGRRQIAVEGQPELLDIRKPLASQRILDLVEVLLKCVGQPPGEQGDRHQPFDLSRLLPSVVFVGQQQYATGGNAKKRNTKRKKTRLSASRSALSLLVATVFDRDEAEEKEGCRHAHQDSKIFADIHILHRERLQSRLTRLKAPRRIIARELESVKLVFHQNLVDVRKEGDILEPDIVFWNRSAVDVVSPNKSKQSHGNGPQYLGDFDVLRERAKEGEQRCRHHSKRAKSNKVEKKVGGVFLKRGHKIEDHRIDADEPEDEWDFNRDFGQEEADRLVESSRPLTPENHSALSKRRDG